MNKLFKIFCKSHEECFDCPYFYLKNIDECKEYFKKELIEEIMEELKNEIKK